MAKVSELYVYPIKSCRALKLRSFRLDFRGPLFDRRWMVVDMEGKFLTQREFPRLALVRPSIAPTSLPIEATGMQKLSIPQTERGGDRVAVQVWKDRGAGEDVGRDAAGWFSEYLQTACRLVRFPDEGVRDVDANYANFPSQVAFADGFPVLMIGEASLKDLNTKLQNKLAMDRFRPNIVVSDSEPYAEDDWKQIRVGELMLDVVKPCTRCVTTLVDQATGEKSGEEPLKTLASYRKTERGVAFGMNCVHHEPGSVSVGDEIQILS